MCLWTSAGEERFEGRSADARMYFGPIPCAQRLRGRPRGQDRDCPPVSRQRRAVAVSAPREEVVITNKMRVRAEQNHRTGGETLEGSFKADLLSLSVHSLPMHLPINDANRNRTVLVGPVALMPSADERLECRTTTLPAGSMAHRLTTLSGFNLVNLDTARLRTQDCGVTF